LGVVKRVGAQPLAVVEGEPVSLDAQHLLVDLNKGTATLSGAVIVKRGELSVSCDSLEARYDAAPNIKWAKASGSVVATLKGLRAQAPEAELLLPEKTLRLRGGVRIMRGGGWIEAKEAQIEMASGKVTLEQVKGSIPVTEIPGAVAPK
jgi:lipopolysaccharide transport protein LptA